MKGPSNEEIVAELEKRGANKPCARCGNNQFSVVSKTMISLQDSLDGSIRIGGESVPAVLVACSNCGNVSFHALGALGLLKRNES